MSFPRIILATAAVFAAGALYLAVPSVDTAKNERYVSLVMLELAAQTNACIQEAGEVHKSCLDKADGTVPKPSGWGFLPDVAKEKYFAAKEKAFSTCDEGFIAAASKCDGLEGVTEAACSSCAHGASLRKAMCDGNGACTKTSEEKDAACMKVCKPE